MRRLASTLLFALCLMSFVAVPLLALIQADSTAVPASAGSQFFSWLGLALGAGAVSLTNIGKWIVAMLDGTSAKLDGKIVAAWKPLQPAIAMVLGVVFAKLHIFGISGEAAAAAPVGVGLSMAMRELLVRLGRLVGLSD